ncbi:MAG: FadR family transcriptional regulator [Rhodospirillales bacterium]|nr:FadR family transcriptional regulator [Rhodospirillales bacterium]
MARDGESSADRDLAAESRTFSRRSLHGLVAHQIGRQIIQGELQPGQLLPNEAAWSARMRVSRTAMREAIKVLAAKGLIESRPKTGTRVRPREFWNFLDPDLLSWQLSAGPIERHIKDLFELRRLVEPAAAEIAARRIDDGDIARLEGAYRGMEAAGDDGTLWVEPDLQFHRAILKATRNELIHSLGAMIESVLAITFHLSSANPRGQRHALPLHSAILDALRRRAPTAARRAMNRLLDKSEKDVRRAVTALRRHGVGLAADGRSRKRQWTGGR